MQFGGVQGPGISQPDSYLFQSVIISFSNAGANNLLGLNWLISLLERKAHRFEMYR